MRKLHAYSHYGDVSSRPTTDLAERISAIAPMEDAAVFFTSGGGESIETVVKLVRRYWSLARPARPHRDHLARARLPRSRRLRNEHRRHRGVQGRRRPARRWTRPGSPGTPPRRSRRRSCELGPERVAAFFCEPIIGAGGVLPAARRLSPGGARDLPRARRAVRRRRGDLRLRPRRRLVRVQPRRARPRRRHVRQGHHLRLRAARRRHRRPHDPGAVLGQRRGGRLAARLHVLGPRERRRCRAREPRHHRARRPRRPRARARDRDPGRARAAARTTSS